MHPSSANHTRPGRAGSVLLALLLAVAGVFALAGTSKAADHTITADHGRLTLGAVFPDNTVIPAPVAGPNCPSTNPTTPTPDPADCGPSPLSPLLPNTSPNATIGVDVNGSTATVAADDFKFPMVYVPQPGSPDTMVPIRAEAPDGLTGNWDAATGELNLTGTLRINIYTGAHGAMDPTQPPNPPGNANPVNWPPVFEICQIDAPNVTWSTGKNAVTPGVPFTTPQGLDGEGAVSASWSDLPNGTEVDGGDCSTVNSVIHDTGAIWLSNGIENPPPPPTCEDEGKEGLWPDCQDIPVPPKQAKITGVKLLPKKRTLRAGKNLKLRVRVVNKGDKGKWVTVKLKVNRKKGVRIRKQVKIWAKPGGFGQKAVPFKTNRKKARGKYKVVARGAGKKANSIIKVKPVKKKRNKRKRR